MSINTSDLVFLRSATVNDTGTNGGLPSTSVVINNTVNNILPDVGDSERSAGSIKKRKVFFACQNSANETYYDARVFLENTTAGADSIVLVAGSFSDTQSAITGTRNYGCGYLTNTVSSGVSSIVVTTEGAALDYFKVGDMVRISDKANVDAAGNEEYGVIDTVSYAGDECTIGLVSPLAYGYSNLNTRVASVYQAGDVKSGLEGVPVVTSAAGTFDAASIVTDNRATPYGQWAITLTSATTYTVAGPGGISGSGTLASSYTYINPAYGVSGLVIPPSCFGGTYAFGDTITFVVKPAMIPLWIVRTVPAGCPVAINNRFVVAVDGESA